MGQKLNPHGLRVKFAKIWGVTDSDALVCVSRKLVANERLKGDRNGKV